MPVRIGTGFGLPMPDAYWYSPAAFGFGGMGGSLGFADPESGLAFGYVMNRLLEGVPDTRAASLLAAVKEAMKLYLDSTAPSGSGLGGQSAPSRTLRR